MNKPCHACGNHYDDALERCHFCGIENRDKARKYGEGATDPPVSPAAKTDPPPSTSSAGNVEEKSN